MEKNIFNRNSSLITNTYGKCMLASKHQSNPLKHSTNNESSKFYNGNDSLKSSGLELVLSVVFHFSYFLWSFVLVDYFVDGVDVCHYVSKTMINAHPNLQDHFLLYFSLFSLDTVKSLHGIISFVLAM